MAVYKVPQDVEAEDKFLGPLSFKQFLFFGGVLIFGYITFTLTIKGLWPVALIFFLPTTVFGFLAFPWSKEQPTELWLASRIRFLIKPRKRIWNQTGIKDLVKITVPKKVVHDLTDGLNQHQVRDRMSALASVIDSRGWATKNYNPKSSSAQTDSQYAYDEYEESDRLVEGTVTNENPMGEIVAETKDVMDENNGVIAKQFEAMINQSSQLHQQERKQLVNNARGSSASSAKPKNQEDFWFMHQNKQNLNDPNLTTFQSSPLIAPGSDNTTTDGRGLNQTTSATDYDLGTLNEEELLHKVHDKQDRDKLQTSSIHEKHIQPLREQNTKSSKQNSNQKTTVTPPKDPVILDLAKSNDLNVDTISRVANRDLPDDEVVISLH
jgi:hypothetical protein